MKMLHLVSLFSIALMTGMSDAFTVVPSSTPTISTSKNTRTNGRIITPSSSTPSLPIHHHHYRPTSTLLCGLLDSVQGFFKQFTTKATASHILVKGGAEAENFLEDLKVEIDNSPIKFAEAAALHSSCPSASKGGNLGEFGPGQMVKEFDTIVFNEKVGQVHGPIKTQFGYHLIFIDSRTE